MSLIGSRLPLLNHLIMLATNQDEGRRQGAVRGLHGTHPGVRPPPM
jgi:hypothetical protein